MRSITDKIILKNQGLHSGKECVLTIEPAVSDFIIMRSADSDQELNINEFKLNGTGRGSDYIFSDGTKIKTCEHVLSALTGLDVWRDVKITVEGGEMPSLDGCADMLTQMILNNSIERPENSCALNLKTPLIVSNDDKTRFVAAFPNYDGLYINYSVEYEFIGAQIFDYVHSPENYIKNIARARTFAYERDINYLRSHGMAMGGNLDNAVILGSEIKAKDGLRWKHEFVRHKILDLIGDLAAIGKKLNAHIIALRAGHELHLKLSQIIKELCK